MHRKWSRWAAAGVLGALLTGGTSFAATVATPVTMATTVTQSTYAPGAVAPAPTAPAVTPRHVGLVVRLLARDARQTVAQVQQLLARDGNWRTAAAALHLNPTTVSHQLGARRRAHQRQAVIVNTLARLAHKTPAQVRAMRTKGEKWSQVAQALGQNWVQVRKQVGGRLHAMAIGRVRKQAIVSLLARLSGKKPAQVAAMLTKGKTWVDVAHSLGIQ